MGKENVNDVTAVREAAVASQEAQTPVAEVQETKVSMVICAFPGTEDVMLKFWDKMCPQVLDKKVMTVQEDFSIPELLADLVADETVADDFILIPANCVPCGPVSFDELHTPLVFKDGKGGLHYCHRLPVPGLKGAIVDVLGTDNTGNPESVMKRYLTSLGRPVEASFREGNYVTPVLRGAPCGNVVMEAVIRKKYIAANPVGFAAVRSLLVNALLNE